MLTRRLTTAIALTAMGLLYNNSRHRNDDMFKNGNELTKIQDEKLINIIDPFNLNSTDSIYERFRAVDILNEWNRRRDNRYVVASSNGNTSKTNNFFGVEFLHGLKDTLKKGEFFINEIGCAFPPGPILRGRSNDFRENFLIFLQDTVLGGLDNPSQRESAKVVIKHDLLNFWATEEKLLSTTRDDDIMMKKEDKAEIKQKPSPKIIETALERNGYAKIDSWGLSKEFLRRLTTEVKNATKSHGGKSTLVMSSKAELKSLSDDPEGQNLLRRGILPYIARRYLGQKAVLSGYVALRLEPGITPKKYISALWHHDRCGRRLKAFLFLHDVTNEHQPTEVAVGSHRTLYYSYHKLRESRFNDSWVRSNYHTEAMTGPELGGFIFDTNTIHRGGGMAQGGKTRLVIIFEINDHPKSTDFHNISNIVKNSKIYPDNKSIFESPPCPSGLYRLDWRLHSSTITGEKMFRPSHRYHENFD